MYPLRDLCLDLLHSYYELSLLILNKSLALCQSFLFFFFFASPFLSLLAFSYNLSFVLKMFLQNATFE